MPRSLSSPGALPLPGQSAGRRRLPRGAAPASAWGGLLPSPGLLCPALQPRALRAREAGGSEWDGQGERTAAGSTREGTAAAAEPGGVRPRRAALPLFLLSFPFPSPASAFSSQTHRSSPINPPRCSRGTPLASPSGFIPPPSPVSC